MKTLRTFSLAMSLLAGLMALPATPAQAAEADVRALQECIRQSTSGRDRITSARWLVSALGSAPQLRDVARIDPDVKRDLDREMAQLFTRLMTVDCLNEAKPVWTSRDPAEMQAAGGSLGEIAMQELFTNPETASAVSAYAQFLNEEDFAALRN
jgi:hypothetical protein